MGYNKVQAKSEDIEFLEIAKQAILNCKTRLDRDLCKSLEVSVATICRIKKSLIDKGMLEEVYTRPLLKGETEETKKVIRENPRTQISKTRDLVIGAAPPDIIILTTAQVRAIASKWGYPVPKPQKSKRKGIKRDAPSIKNGFVIEYDDMLSVAFGLWVKKEYSEMNIEWSEN